jgi:hypothetical protein
MEQTKREFGLIFWIHLFLILFSYLSFLYIDWKIIFIGVVLLQLYYFFRGGCDLTFKEFGKDKNITFVWYYLNKIFPKLDQRKTRYFVRFFLPIALILVSAYSQVVLDFKPFFNL